MVIELTGETEAMLLRMATQTGLTPAEVVAETLALSDLDDVDERKLIELRIQEADRPDAVFISNEEVRRRLGLI